MERFIECCPSASWPCEKQRARRSVVAYAKASIATTER
jgi:hypothetical protein